MKLYISQFTLGLMEKLASYKLAEGEVATTEHSDSSNSILPTFQNQAKWKFARTPNALHLSDGSKVYSFSLPGEDKGEDMPVDMLPTVGMDKFEEGSTSKGTAQVHHSSPGSMYFTLQNGTSNPTYTLQHIKEQSWKALPKKKLKKLVEQLDKEEATPKEHNTISPVLDVQPSEFKSAAIATLNKRGFLDTVDKLLGSGLSGARDTAFKVPGFLYDHPVASTGLGVGAGALYDQYKQMTMSPKDKKEQTTEDRLKRYLIPGGAALLGSGLAHSLFNKVPTPEESVIGTEDQSFGGEAPPNPIPSIKKSGLAPMATKMLNAKSTAAEANKNNYLKNQDISPEAVSSHATENAAYA